MLLRVSQLRCSLYRKSSSPLNSPFLDPNSWFLLKYNTVEMYKKRAFTALDLMEREPSRDFISTAHSSPRAEVNEALVWVFLLKNHCVLLASLSFFHKKTAPWRVLIFYGARDEAVLDLLHAHRVSPFVLRTSRLYLFAPRIRSLCSLHPSQIRSNSIWVLASVSLYTKKHPIGCYLKKWSERRGCLARSQ